MWISREVWQHLLKELDKERERVDKLTEAIARKNSTTTMLPPRKPRSPQEPSDDYFATKNPIFSAMTKAFHPKRIEDQ